MSAVRLSARPPSCFFAQHGLIMLAPYLSVVCWRYHDSHRPRCGSTWGNNVVGSRKPCCRQVQVAVCVRVVKGMSRGRVSGIYNICGIAGYLTDICILHMARNLTDICVYNKTIRNADDVDDARRFDADLWVGGRQDTLGCHVDTLRLRQLASAYKNCLKGRHVARSRGQGISWGKRQIKENSAHIKSQSQSPKTVVRWGGGA